jgi:CheY-like chemotaxis protein
MLIPEGRKEQNSTSFFPPNNDLKFIMEKPITILLVDDDNDDRKLFTEAVGEFDNRITCINTPDGLAALQYLNNNMNSLPDFIFLDLRMPGLSGQQCIEEIKKVPQLMHIPVIVYTTSNDVEESIKLKSMGASHFMSKPTSPEEVYYMVSLVLGEKWK